MRGPSEDLSRWWTVFRDPVLRSEDPVLDRLVSTAYRQNLSLGEAGFRILEARAQLGIAQGELFPQVQDATGAFRRQGTSLSAPSGLFSPKRVAGGTDRRIRCLRLTPRGERIMRLREEARVHRVLAALEHLSPQVRSEVVGTLETLLDACDATRGRDGQQSVRLAAKADC